jgi:hypothetical protein
MRNGIYIIPKITLATDITSNFFSLIDPRNNIKIISIEKTRTASISWLLPQRNRKGITAAIIAPSIFSSEIPLPKTILLYSHIPPTAKREITPVNRTGAVKTMMTKIRPANIKPVNHLFIKELSIFHHYPAIQKSIYFFEDVSRLIAHLSVQIVFRDFDNQQWPLKDLLF